MHAYLIISRNPQGVSIKAGEIAAKNKGRVVVWEIKTIDDARELTKISRFSYNKPVYYLLENIHLASPETFGAILKTIEEPPPNVNFILSAPSEYLVPATIVSRCQIIYLPGEFMLDEKLFKEAEAFLDGDIGQKFSQIALISNRQEARLFLEAIIVSAHRKIQNDINNRIKLVGILETASECLHRIEQNGNVRLQLTAFLTRF